MRERGRVRETVHQVVHGWQQVPVRKGSEFFLYLFPKMTVRRTNSSLRIKKQKNRTIQKSAKKFTTRHRQVHFGAVPFDRLNVTDSGSTQRSDLSLPCGPHNNLKSVSVVTDTGAIWRWLF